MLLCSVLGGQLRFYSSTCFHDSNCVFKCVRVLFFSDIRHSGVFWIWLFFSIVHLTSICSVQRRRMIPTLNFSHLFPSEHSDCPIQAIQIEQINNPTGLLSRSYGSHVASSDAPLISADRLSTFPAFSTSRHLQSSFSLFCPTTQWLA